MAGQIKPSDSSSTCLPEAGGGADSNQVDALHQAVFSADAAKDWHATKYAEKVRAITHSDDAMPQLALADVPNLVHIDRAGNSISRTPDGVFAHNRDNSLAYSYTDGTEQFTKQTKNERLEITRGPDHQIGFDFAKGEYRTQERIIPATAGNGVSTEITLPEGPKVIQSGVELAHRFERNVRPALAGEDPAKLPSGYIETGKDGILVTSRDGKRVGKNLAGDVYLGDRDKLYRVHGGTIQIRTADGSYRDLNQDERSSVKEDDGKISAAGATVLANGDVQLSDGRVLHGENGAVVIEQQGKYNLRIDSGHKSTLTDARGSRFVYDADHPEHQVYAQDDKGRELFKYDTAHQTFSTPEIVFNEQATTLWSGQTVFRDGRIVLQDGSSLGDSTTSQQAGQQAGAGVAAAYAIVAQAYAAKGDGAYLLPAIVAALNQLYGVAGVATVAHDAQALQSINDALIQTEIAESTILSSMNQNHKNA